MRRILLCVALLVPAALGAHQDTTRLRWVPNPRVAGGGWVADPAGHLRAATIATINAEISTLERETSAEIGVAVLDSLDGLEPADAALLLHRRWGVGKSARDNGIVLLWSPALRKIYVSVGYGLEGVLPDAKAGRIQDEAMLPAFRNGDFDGGMLAGVRGLASAAREETYSGLERATARSRARGAGHFLGYLIAVPFVAAGALLLRRRPRRCPKGHGRMRKLSEKHDDTRLAREDVLEERLGSMNYDVFVCDQCNEQAIVARRKWFTSYSQCPKCKRRTMRTDSKTLRRATTTSTGEKLVTRTCKNCRFTDQRTESIPMIVASSGGSSSGFSGGGGGSSFGGGSAGGGGAGRSY
jgi:uncharacterized protein